MIIGIDPGLTGAIAFIQDSEILAVHDMPIVEKQRGKGRWICAYLLTDLIDEAISDYGKPDHCYIEFTSSHPGQGVSSTYSLGDSAGVIRGVVAAKGIPATIVAAQAWKRFWGLDKKPKDASRSMVLNLYPENSKLFSRMKDHGRADAVLIGLYGEKNF